jgi:MFS family permease
VVVLAASQLMRKPPVGWLPPSKTTPIVKKPTKVKQSLIDYTPQQMLKSGTFYLIYLMMVMVAFGGLMATAQLKPIGESYGYDKYFLFAGLTVVNLAVPLNQILNGVARPFFGSVADRLGRYDTMALVFGLEALSLVALTALVGHPAGFVVIFAIVFFAFGDIYSSFPSAIADIFGVKHSTTNYGIQYTAKGFGAVLGGPFAAWMMQKSGGSWLPVFWLAFSFNVIAALLAVLWLKPMVARRVKNELEVSITQSVTESSSVNPAKTAQAVGTK